MESGEVAGHDRVTVESAAARVFDVRRLVAVGDGGGDQVREHEGVRSHECREPSDTLGACVRLEQSGGNALAEKRLVDDHVCVTCERPDTLADTCVAADNDADTGSLDSVAHCGFDRMMVDERRPYSPLLGAQRCGHITRWSESEDLDAGSRTGFGAGLGVEAVVVEDLETPVREPRGRAFGRVNNERHRAAGRPPCDRQRREVADVVRVVVGEEHPNEPVEVESGGDRAQRCASSAVDQHPRVLIGDRHSRSDAVAVAVQVRRPTPEHHNLDHVVTMPHRRPPTTVDDTRTTPRPATCCYRRASDKRGVECQSGGVTDIQPELWIHRAADAVEFYCHALGAEVLHRVGDGDDIVAQLCVGDARFWVAAANSTMRRFDPMAIGGTTGRVLLVVEDPDAVWARAVAAGAEPSSPVQQEHGWRVGRMVDPFGHEWEIGALLGPTAPAADAPRPSTPPQG